ncbi:glycosyltransferase family 87 protein [Soonwooa sp.]|uniref:glycosyltransferase family 87 protein n=1 Tax=Soonwooa sp. TaxID=1938592 RepID=UPI0028A992A8|nr:glycosyltransferase family 87 protein [Soonwooa sp.]
MKTKFLNFISNPKYIGIIYIIVSAASALSKYKRGPGAYNNYLIFKNVFFNTLKERNLYAHYPDLYFDCNHYGIIFSALIAPFAVMPDWMGITLWNVANTFVFLFAVKSLAFTSKNKAFFLWLCLQEFITASVSLQFNVALTGLLILSATYIYKEKEVKSALAIALGIFVKIYGIVGLSAFFFIKNKLKFMIALAVFCILFFLIPMAYSSPHFGVQAYIDWFTELKLKNNHNQVLDSYQDISVMGLVRRILQNANISNLTFMAIGLPLFALPYIRIRQYKHLAFKLLILASTLLFTVLFSSGSESPTYIIAVPGVMIWFLIQKDKKPWDIALLVFVLLLTCFSNSDLFPKFIKENYIFKYSLKALPCTVVWLRIIYELMTRNFETDYKVAS